MASDQPETESITGSLAGESLTHADPEPVAGIQSAYLVMRSAGRWADVFRLAAPMKIVLGRSSSNDIALRSEKASRRHALVWSTPNGWVIQDQGSRNGTRVAGRLIQEPTPLQEGDRIEIAGFTIQFVHQIQSAEGPVAQPMPAGATEDQLTMELDGTDLAGASITDRRSQSGFLHDPFSSDPETAASRSSSGERTRLEHARAQLLQMAFALAGAESPLAAIDLVLDRLAESVPFRSAGAFIRKSSKGKSTSPITATQMSLVATRQNILVGSGSTTYRRPADAAIARVIQPGGQAILARNVSGDASLATENSQGEIDAVSMILTPVRDREANLVGMLHLVTTDTQSTFGPADLEFVLAAAEILAESLRNLRVRGKLDRSLQRSQREIQTLKQQLSGKVQIVGRSDSVREIIDQVAMVAPTDATVLVRGESGVGKELIASAIHYASSRSGGPLICMNCAALSPSLLESELFGHEKGAFTGATDRKLGKFEAADGGTLMLDEIGEMDAEIQAKFLRVLEGHPFERVGGQAAIKVDVRVVAATNRDLQAMVREGKFRQDLFYRLHVIDIVVPPLRKRGSDILLLAEHFLTQFNTQMGRRIVSISDAARKMLMEYRWPGNIRELKNVIERAVVLNAGTTIESKHLLLTPAMLGGDVSQESAGGLPQSPVEISLAELERQHIERVLSHTDGNKSRAALILGIERSTLDRKLKKFAKEDG